MVKKEFSGKVMINSRGNEVPVEMVRKDHLKRDRVVDKIFGKAKSFESKMNIAKEKIFDDVNSFQKFWRKYHKSEKVEDLNNLTLSNYANTKRVVIKTNDIIQLDDTRQLAEAKIKSCLKKWGQNAHPFLKQVVDELFKTNKEGLVNVTDLRALKQYEINDPEWVEAMDLLSKSETPIGKRQYIILQERVNQNAKWKTLNLNFSSAGKEEEVQVQE